MLASVDVGDRTPLILCYFTFANYCVTECSGNNVIYIVRLSGTEVNNCTIWLLFLRVILTSIHSDCIKFAHYDVVFINTMFVIVTSSVKFDKNF